jgi:hypothetical protein
VNVYEANSKLRFGIALLKDEGSWNQSHTRFNKVAVIEDLICQLENGRFWWQAERLRNQLNLWKQNQKFFSHQRGLQPKADTSSRGEEVS